MRRTWQMPPLACAPNTIPRRPAPKSRTALRAGGEARYRCRPVIVTPQDGPAGEGCGLVAVASGTGAELLARDGVEVCEQPEQTNAIAASAQPRTLSHFSGDPRVMSQPLRCALGAARCLRGGREQYGPQTLRARCHAGRVYSDFGVIRSESGVMALPLGQLVIAAATLTEHTGPMPRQADRHRRISLLFDLFAVSNRVRVLLRQAMAYTGLRPDEYAI